jgi:predicted transcriptional regulator
MRGREKESGNEGLTKAELQLMQVIWRLGPSTVGAVQEELEQRLAYTTVQTMLNILVKKGKLTRALAGQAYTYSATVSRAKAAGHAVRDLVERMFGGSSEELVMSLLQSGELDAQKIAELSRRLDAAKREEADDENA